MAGRVSAWSQKASQVELLYWVINRGRRFTVNSRVHQPRGYYPLACIRMLNFVKDGVARSVVLLTLNGVVAQPAVKFAPVLASLRAENVVRQTTFHKRDYKSEWIIELHYYQLAERSRIRLKKLTNNFWRRFEYPKKPMFLLETDCIYNYN